MEPRLSPWHLIPGAFFLVWACSSSTPDGEVRSISPSAGQGGAVAGQAGSAPAAGASSTGGQTGTGGQGSAGGQAGAAQGGSGGQAGVSGQVGGGGKASAAGQGGASGDGGKGGGLCAVSCGVASCPDSLGAKHCCVSEVACGYLDKEGNCQANNIACCGELLCQQSVFGGGDEFYPPCCHADGTCGIWDQWAPTPKCVHVGEGTQPFGGSGGGGNGGNPGMAGQMSFW